MKTLIAIALLSLFAFVLVAATSCNLPKVKQPTFTQQADSVFAHYREIYKPESINIQYTTSSDSTSSINIIIVNSQSFSFDQQSELSRIGQEFANELIHTIQNSTDFSYLKISYTWKKMIMTRSFTVTYPITPSDAPAADRPDSIGTTATTTATQQQ